MDIRQYLIGGSKTGSQPTNKQESSQKRPIQDVDIGKSKTIKTTSKYFSGPADTPESSDTEVLPPSPEDEPHTVKKQAAPNQPKEALNSSKIKLPTEIPQKNKLPPKKKSPQNPEKPSSPVNKSPKNASNNPVNAKKMPKKPISPQRKPEKTIKSCIGEVVTGSLSGKTFVITGLLKDYDRDSLTDLIKEHGGRVTGNVSKRTSYLIHGYKLEDGRHFTLGNKYKKAEELGTKILDEEETKKILDECISAKLLQEEEEEKRFEEDQQKVSDRIPIPKIVIANTHIPNSQQSSSLWVDKYKPRCLSDLIGNTQIIKRLQDWLEDWESVILHHNPKAISPGRGGKYDASTNINAAAVLLSGPPGIGKTTAARLVAEQYGYRVMEMNASDTRSKKLLTDPLSSSSISHCLSNTGDIVKNLIIMDEVDGMSAGDRGGTAALINIIKFTKNPIICICNDRQSAKVKSLVNHCYDLKFIKPNKLQLTRKMCELLKAEGLTIEPNAVEQLVEASGNDIRQVLTALEMWARNSNNMSYMRAKQSLRTMTKDSVSMLSNFDAATKLFNHREMSKLQHKEKIDLAFVDYELIPLLVYENYISATPEGKLREMAEAAEAISLGDCLSTSIRTGNNWSLLPQFLQLSCIHPPTLCQNTVPFTKFPEWFGRFSTQRKNERLIKELQMALGGVACSGFESMISEYIPILYELVMKPLRENNPDEAASVLHEFNLTPDMLKEHLGSFSCEDEFKDIPSGIKRKFTTVYNNLYKSSIDRVRNKRKGEGSKDQFDPEYQEVETIDNGEDGIEEEEEVAYEVKPTIKTKRRK